ncbi:MAG: non-homologous end-joining DNA ligase [Actinobacteria bacterium]|nr:non-homologous end-joining DNA ligase [Actinomycetota bacterium]
MATDAVTVEASGREVRITHPDKVFFSKAGATKLDLVRYYQAVGDPLLRTIQGRPTLMQRFPDGASGKSFFQKRVPKGTPDWIETTELSTPNGTTSNALVVADLAHLLWAVNMGCLGFHPWPFHAATPGTTDELRVDLDPSPGIGFDQVREAAIETRSLLADEGITSYVKTSGSRGLHVYVHLATGWDSYEVRQAAVALARELERRRPDLLTAAWWKEERGPRVFVDYNQNAPHKTVFGAWCVRPRVGGQVSCPVRWDEVPTFDPEALTLDVVPDRVAADGDPWEPMGGDPQDIGPLLARYRKDLDDGVPDAPWPPVYPKMPHEPPRVAPSRARQND